MAPDQHTEEPIKAILGGAMNLVNGLGMLRNRLSDSHGRGAIGSRHHVMTDVRFAMAISLDGNNLEARPSGEAARPSSQVATRWRAVVEPQGGGLDGTNMKTYLMAAAALATVLAMMPAIAKEDEFKAAIGREGYLMAFRCRIPSQKHSMIRGLNREGYPNQLRCDSSCMLAKEASMHGPRALFLDLHERVVDAIGKGIS